MSDQKNTVSGQPLAVSWDDRIMSAIPLMAPVPTAWMIGLSTFELMGFPLPVAVVSALTVEGIGFVSINTANEMREFNRHLNAVESKQKMNAPTRQAYGVAGLYLTTATLMTVVLHIFPEMLKFAPLPFILMTAAGGWLWALRREHADRVAKWQEGRSKATLKRRSAKTSDAASDGERTPATLSDPSSDAQRRSAKKSAKVYRCACGEQYTDRYKYSGHTRQCAVHKSMKDKPIPVDLGVKNEVQS